VEVQDALERCVVLNTTDMNWRIDEVGVEALCKLLTCYDQQFAAAPLHRTKGPKKQMRQSVRGDLLLPWTRR
jgi:hypothetical protein